jgi:hypothetical protein
MKLEREAGLRDGKITITDFLAEGIIVRRGAPLGPRTN